ncbi:MAG: RusA family crossover junction endodeoxyribonuclease [Nitrospiraceae bacterium]|nr:RusA family crossover junction endodeoxyribonuclease [Nitrospiraceae bacterium]
MISADHIALTLPLPPSINHQYATVNNRRVLSAVGRRYKNEVGRQVLVALAHSAHREALLQTLRSAYLTLTIRFHFSSPLRRDVDGGLKITQDALCEALGLNDSRVFEVHLCKIVGATLPCIEVTLSRTTLTGMPTHDPDL